MYAFDPNDAQAVATAVNEYLRSFTASYFGLEPEGEGVEEAISGIRAGLASVPDEEQENAIASLANYMHSEAPNEVLVLRGSAGTGKTSLMRGLATYLKQLNRPIVLIAPTGRAAKVLAQRTGLAAYTIHRQIYALEERYDKGGHISGFAFLLKHFESEEPVVFVADEASMISSMPVKEGQYQMNGLLPDLLQHVFGSSGWNRLVLVGDPFQLPPVHEIESAALRSTRLRAMGMQLAEIDLHIVKRQAGNSGILQLATQVRNQLQQRQIATNRVNNIDSFERETSFDPYEAGDDVLEIASTEAALDLYVDLYRRDPDNVVFVTYSNYWAHKLNVRLRRILQPEADRLPMPGEQLLVVRNHFLKNRDFIANGETVEVVSHANELEEYAGLQWLAAELAFTDLKGRRQYLQSRLLFDLLNSKEAGLSAAHWQLLWRARRHAETFGPYDPYLNALQVKYSYAITGHKAQGGEWPHVFVLLERPYGGDEQHLRWLYTAITRAKERVYLVRAV
jgi:exodeoxyribonuclease-5